MRTIFEAFPALQTLRVLRPAGDVAPPLVGLLLFFVFLHPSAGVAQQGPGASLGSQTMRPYAHVFWAYGLAWALVLGWIISLGRRWSRVEHELEEGPPRE